MISTMKQEPTHKITIPQFAKDELDEVEKEDFEFSLDDLANLVNDAVDRFFPEANESSDKRVSTSFTVRTLRHYQTQGCLDSPQKDGRRAIYSFRHYMQALLIRKLLYLRCPPETIKDTLQGKTIKQYKSMLFSDLDLVPSQPSKVAFTVDTKATEPTTETWNRITLSPNLELHIKKPTKRMSAKERKALIAQIEAELKRI